MSRRVQCCLCAVALALAVAVTGAGTLTASAAPALPDDTALPDGTAEVVVKVNTDEGHSIDELVRDYPVAVDSALLASRGIYLLRPTDDRYRDAKDADKLAKQIAKNAAVQYAERNTMTTLDGTGNYHAWPDGSRVDAGSDPSVWSDQEAASQLQLSDVHHHATGAGAVVAVLDTGVDHTHSALAGRLLDGYDYVDDDADPTEMATSSDTDGDGTADEAFGHGTFVSGVIRLVAPEARVLPYRVLDSDGVGNVFTVAQAMNDAMSAGADVINLSFGTATKLKSHLLSDIIKDAVKRGVIVVAAAGNEANDHKYYPAADDNVLSVSAVSNHRDDELADFANWGDWVDIAAPGERIAGPVPEERYAYWSGTSMATPFASAEAALLRGAHPDLSANKIHNAIAKSATVIKEKKIKYGEIDLAGCLRQAEIA